MPSVAEFLIERLENSGIKHVFGVPGDYILHFFSNISKSKKVQLINNTDEEAAGFAADAYARVSSISCVCVTYAVGALKLLNPIAEAYAERSPVIVVSGSPGIAERGEMTLHHPVGNSIDAQRQMFKYVTCAQAFLDNPTTAGYEIDRVIDVLRYNKRPVYIELPRDVSKMPIHYDVYTQGTPKSPTSDLHNLEDALKEVGQYLEDAKNPVILAGVELARCKLGKDLIRFAERHNIPIAATLLSKSVINEMHPLYIGVYAGSNTSQLYVKEMVENSDCLLVCGEVLTEATVGYRPSKVFQKIEMITCTFNNLTVRNHHYPNVLFSDFCKALFKVELTPKPRPALPEKKDVAKFSPKTDTKLTISRLFEKINSVLDDNTVVIADVGDSLFGASDLSVHHAGTFYAPALYLSMGYAIPAALGVKLAKPAVKPIVLVGDGAFQMSCGELGNFVKYNLDAVVVLLNNKGYTTERIIVDGGFNNIPDWQYHKFANMIGCEGCLVTNEVDLVNALTKALDSKKLSIINCMVDSLDVSPALVRVAESLARKVNKG